MPKAVTAPRDAADAHRKAYGMAQTRLMHNHAEEFTQLRVEESEKLGFPWEPPVSPYERAVTQAKELFAAYPDLKREFVPQGATQTPQDTPQ